MDLQIFIIVAIVSIILAFTWQIAFFIYPAYKSAKIASCLAILAKCAKKLDQDALLNARISNGHYLHDKFYKLIFCILTHKVNLTYGALMHVTYDEEAEKECLKFRSEISSLDSDTREIIERAIYSIALIMMFRNPIIFISFCIKTKANRKEHVSKESFRSGALKQRLKKNMTKSAEILTVKAGDNDVVFVPC